MEVAPAAFQEGAMEDVHTGCLEHSRSALDEREEPG